MDKDDFESELLRILDWIIFNEPGAITLDSTIADDAIALMINQQARIAELELILSATMNMPMGSGKTHTADQMLAWANTEG